MPGCLTNSHLDSTMTDALSRTPPEIWELILQSAIDYPRLFENTCTHDTYVEFRSVPPDYLEVWEAAEKVLKQVGAVCRAWRDFQQRNTNRWVDLLDAIEPPLPSNEIIRNGLRVEVGPRYHQHFLNAVNEPDPEGGWYRNRISALTLNLRYFNAEYGIEATFSDFAGNSAAFHNVTYMFMTLARSYFPVSSSTFFGIISEACPNLIGFDVGPFSSIIMDQPLRFRHLEVLVLRSFRPSSTMWGLPEIDLSVVWDTPRLSHFAVSNAPTWSITQYNYFKTMISKVESLHLGFYNDYTLPKTFWTDFPNLKLFLADWEIIDLREAGFPPKEYPLEIIAQEGSPIGFKVVLEKWEDRLSGEDLQRGKLKRVFIQCNSLGQETIMETEEHLKLKKICEDAGIELELGYENLI